MEYNRPSAQSDKRPRLIGWIIGSTGGALSERAAGQKERAASANLIIAIWMIRVYTCL